MSKSLLYWILRCEHWLSIINFESHFLCKNSKQESSTSKEGAPPILLRASYSSRVYKECYMQPLTMWSWTLPKPFPHNNTLFICYDPWTWCQKSLMWHPLKVPRTRILHNNAMKWNLTRLCDKAFNHASHAFMSKTLMILLSWSKWLFFWKIFSCLINPYLYVRNI